jgi:starch phosphorylase
MSALAIRLTSFTNGVSKRHAEVATGDWSEVIGGPAAAITNAIHLPTWTGRQMAGVWESVLGFEWPNTVADPAAGEAIRRVEPAQLWEAHLAQKEIMIGELRLRLLEQGARQGSASPHLRRLYSSLPVERLTIVFARRFATYKRAQLLFHDMDRLTSVLTSPDRPVQVVFAGKAHPADRSGQDLIKSVMAIATKGPLLDHVFYIENYDMGLARYLVTGADVWLNTPQPPKEASGTSGMKAAANGALNLSVLDGWWLEGYNGHNGWGWGTNGDSDDLDAATLYDLIETEVAPLYYDTDDDGLPTRWIGMMAESLATLVGPFSTTRMLREYTERAYSPHSRS